MRSGVRIRLSGLGLAGLVFAAGGCADRTTPTGVTPPAFASAHGSRGGLRLISNSVPYAVRGVRPAKGRSGSAAISATATIQGASAVLTVTSFRASDTDFSDPVGNIDKLEVKAYDASGRLLFVDHRDHLRPTSSIRSFTYAGLPPGATFVVRANVKGIDHRRTDVVTVPAVIVAKAVDLALTSLSIPSSVTVNRIVPITATVRELNGDQNARANVVLSVQGVPVQTIQNVYVAAGDAVSCAFAYAFPAVSVAVEVSVAVQNVVPTDGNPANNGLTKVLSISSQQGSGNNPPPPVLQVTGDGHDLTIDQFDSTRTKQWDPWLGGVTAPGSFDSPTVPPTDDRISYTYRAGREQLAELFGQYLGALTFPIDSLILRQGLRRSSTSPGIMDTVVDQYSGAGLTANGGGTAPCFSASGQAGVFFSVCGYPDGFTRLTYVRGLQNVTYVSQRFDFLAGSPACASQPGTLVASDSVAVADGLQCYFVSNAAGPASGFATWVGYQSLVLAVILETGGVRFAATLDIPLVASSAADQPLDGLQPFSARPAQTVCFPGLGCQTIPGAATWTYVKHRYSEAGIYASARTGVFSGVLVTTP